MEEALRELRKESAEIFVEWRKHEYYVPPSLKRKEKSQRAAARRKAAEKKIRKYNNE